MTKLIVGFKELQQGGQKIVQTIRDWKNAIPSLQDYAKATKVMAESKQGVIHEMEDLLWATDILTTQGSMANVAKTVCSGKVVPTLEEYRKATQIMEESQQGIIHELKDLKWASNILSS